MFDLHVHAAPDVWERAADDAQTVRWYQQAGFTGCVLKGHYDATAGRAVAAGNRVGLRVYGGQVLNQHAGGINPAAVAAALAMGARVIWMPTADAHTQRTAGLPRLCGAYPGLADTVYAIPPVDPATEGAVRQIAAMVADADAVLATGHLSTAEVAWLLPVARRAGVRRLLMTHPGYTVPDMPPADAARLARENGAFAEVTAFQLLHQPGCGPARLAGFVRQVGYEHVVLSSDAGQPDSPPPPQALTQLVDALAGEGLDRSALLACASEIPERLVVP
jgi:hypothetical protein